MKKKILLLFLAIITVCSFTACTVLDGDDDDPPVPVVGTPIDYNYDGTGNTQIGGDSFGGASDSDVNYITNRVVLNGMMQSYLTGEWKNADIANRRPMAVMIPNNKSAMPQYGISKASIYYEAPMESQSCTRIMGIFEDYDELDHIGPIRSSRLYFLKEAMSFDAIYCNWGLAVPYVGPVINTDAVDNISAAVMGIDNPSDEAFERDAERKAAGYATEYTGILTIDGYNSAVKRQGYETTYRDRYEQNFLFAKDGYVATYDDFSDAAIISPGGTSADHAGGGYAHNKPYFVYDPDTHLYTRYQFGAEQIDEYNDEVLQVRNIIFKICDSWYADNNGYIYMEVEGEGSFYMFTEGKLVTGVWKKEPGDSTATHYYVMGEEEMILNQGKTWVCLIWGDYQSYITVSN